MSTARTVRSPGRVNLVGEHTDYNDGWVLPMAINRELRLTFERIPEPRLELSSPGRSPVAVSLADEGRPRADGGWGDYAAGMAWALREDGLETHGARGQVRSDLPIGSGLSSSAALELAVAWAVVEEPERVDPMRLALLAQRAENEVVGVRSGIMDQAAIALGRAAQALLLDCRSLATRHVALPPAARVVVIDSGAPRELAASAYNERRAECEAAVAILAGQDERVRALRDVSPAALEGWIHLLPPPLDRRARHVVTENARVMEVVEAFAAGDLPAAGAAMVASHRSQRRDYEVSSEPIDALVEIALAVPGVYGARLTGGGFGGCTVNLVAPESVEPLALAVARQYRARTGLEANVMPVDPVDGVCWA